MLREVSPLASRGLEKLYNMKGFYRQEESGARKLLAKEKKELSEIRTSFLGGEGNLADYLTSANQKVSDSLLCGYIPWTGQNCS